MCSGQNYSMSILDHQSAWITTHQTPCVPPDQADELGLNDMKKFPADDMHMLAGQGIMMSPHTEQLPDGTSERWNLEHCPPAGCGAQPLEHL